MSGPPDATLRKLFGGAMECFLPAAYADVSDLRQVPDHQEAFVSREDGISIIIEVLSFEAEISSELDGHGDGASARHFFEDLTAANGASSSACDYCADLSDSIMPKLGSYSKAVLAGRQTVVKFRGDGPPESVRVYLVNVRLPNVGTDLLITANVPYPDEVAAARSMASAECFFPSSAPPPPQQQEQHTTDAGGGVPGVASPEIASASSSSAAAAPLAGGQTPPAVSAAAGDAVASDTSARGVGQGGGSGRPLSSSDEGDGGHGDPGCDVGIAALRSLLHSFSILDWSLFG
ncbi:unnamed protein product [Pylaiella littoralis]